MARSSGITVIIALDSPCRQPLAQLSGLRQDMLR
jgi:hypothetical protein